MIAFLRWLGLWRDKPVQTDFIVDRDGRVRKAQDRRIELRARG